MRSTPARIAIAVGAIALIVALFVVLSGGDGDDGNQAGTTTTPTQTTTPAAKDEPAPAKPPVPVIRIRDGKPVGVFEKLSFTRGERVRFRVVSDVTDEIHVHGFDITREVPAGGSVSFNFAADIEGVFEVELHDLGEQIAQISVRPA